MESRIPVQVYTVSRVVTDSAGTDVWLGYYATNGVEVQHLDGEEIYNAANLVLQAVKSEQDITDKTVVSQLNDKPDIMKSFQRDLNLTVVTRVDENPNIMKSFQHDFDLADLFGFELTAVINGKAEAVWSNDLDTFVLKKLREQIKEGKRVSVVVTGHKMNHFTFVDREVEDLIRSQLENFPRGERPFRMHAPNFSFYLQR